MLLLKIYRCLAYAAQPAVNDSSLYLFVPVIFNEAVLCTQIYIFYRYIVNVCVVTSVYCQ